MNVNDSTDDEDQDKDPEEEWNELVTTPKSSVSTIVFSTVAKLKDRNKILLSGLVLVVYLFMCLPQFTSKMIINLVCQVKENKTILLR